jgi:hypothetical protein
MSSMTPTGSGTMTVPELCAAVAEIESVLDGVATAVADPAALDLGGVPVDLLAALTTRLLRAADRATAVATVTVGQVLTVAGPGTSTLIAGRYARGGPGGAGGRPRAVEREAVIARQTCASTPHREAAWLAGEVAATPSASSPPASRARSSR